MKFFSLVLLSLIPVLIGIWKGEDLKEKMKMKEALLSLLEEILFQIKNFNRDQKEIFASFEDDLLEKCSFLPDLRKETAENPLGAFDRVITFHLKNFSFSKTSEETLLTLSKHFGTQCKERQVEELDKSIFILKEEILSQQKAMADKIKICRTTGLAAGLGIFILLI